MGCRPSKQATSKVRAVDESLCLCSPRKVRKNHKCSSSSARSAAMGSKKHSLSSGHKPRTLEAASMDFPAFSTTTAVYRKSASKTSKITLRLSCDGSTLEIEQCDYDLEKGYGDMTSTPRPWHSAPNLTYLKDKKSRLFREKPMKHSKSTWSPSVSSTVSGCLAMRVPAIINSVENQPSNRSLAVSRPSSNNSQADCGSSNERSNTGKTPLLRTGGKVSTAFGYKNPSSFSRNPDGDPSSNNDYAQQRLNSMGMSSTGNINSRVYSHDKGKATVVQTRTKHYEATDDSDFSDFEHIPVNLVTSFAPSLPSEKSYRLTDSNHNQFHLNDCCMQDNRAKPDANFTSHFRSFTSAQKKSSADTRNSTSVYRINDFSSHEALSVYTSRDSSPVSCGSQIDSNSIMTFVALGCPVPNETSNCSYSSDDDDACGLFPPRQEVTVLQDFFSNHVIDVDAWSSRNDAFSRELCTQARNRFGNGWESRHGAENSSFRTLKTSGSLQDRSRYCNGFTNNTQLTSQFSKVVKNNSKQEWIDGELRPVKDNESDLDKRSGWTAECWTKVKFPLMKTHIPASAVLHDLEETTSRDQVTNNNVGLSSSNSRELVVGETIHLCSSCDLSAWRSNHSMKDDLVKCEAIDEELREVVSVEKKLTDVEQMNSKRLGKVSITADSVIGSADEKSIGNSESMDSETLESKSYILELKNFQLNENNELCFNATNLYEQSQMSSRVRAENNENGLITTFQNDQMNPNSLPCIEQITHSHHRGDADDDGASSLNLYESQTFHGELEVDTLKITPESQKADYLMELLISDTNSTTRKLDEESIVFCGFDNFMENGIYSLTESSESESSFMWLKELSLLSRSMESHTSEIVQTPVRPTNMDLVKINILNSNLNSLDPTHANLYNQITPPVPPTRTSPDTSFANYNESIQKFPLTKSIKARGQREKEMFKHHNSTSVTFDHLTLNGPSVDAHSLRKCKNLKTAQERPTGEVEELLNATTKGAALQSGGQPRGSVIMPLVRDTTSSTIQTCLCPLAPSSNQAEWDIKGKNESMNTSSKLPHSTYCERNLNEKNIDPSEITYLDLGGNSPAFLALPSHLNQTQFVHRAQDSSKCHVEPFLCKTGSQENDCASYNGGHVGPDSIYIEKDNVLRKCDCTCDCMRQKDCLCRLNISTGSNILSKSVFDDLTNGLRCQTLDGRLENQKNVAMDDDLNYKECEFTDNSAPCCRTASLYCKMNNCCNNELCAHCINCHYIDTMDSPEHFMDCIDADHTMGHTSTDLYNENQSKIYQNNERADQRTESIADNEEQHHCYIKCLEKSNNQQTKQHSYVYISEPSYMGVNSYRAKTDAFYVDTVDAVTPRLNDPIQRNIKQNQQIKRNAKQTHSSHFSLDKQESLDTATDGRLSDNDVCKRQSQTDLIFQEYACYRHFSENNHSETIPRNNVLSLVRYFEKVPFINNNAK